MKHLALRDKKDVRAVGATSAANVWAVPERLLVFVRKLMLVKVARSRRGSRARRGRR